MQADLSGPGNSKSVVAPGAIGRFFGRLRTQRDFISARCEGFERAIARLVELELVTWRVENALLDPLYVPPPISLVLTPLGEKVHGQLSGNKQTA